MTLITLFQFILVDFSAADVLVSAISLPDDFGVPSLDTRVFGVVGSHAAFSGSVVEVSEQSHADNINTQTKAVQIGCSLEGDDEMPMDKDFSKDNKNRKPNEGHRSACKVNKRFPYSECLQSGDAESNVESLASTDVDTQEAWLFLNKY